MWSVRFRRDAVLKVSLRFYRAVLIVCGHWYFILGKDKQYGYIYLQGTTMGLYAGSGHIVRVLADKPGSHCHAAGGAHQGTTATEDGISAVRRYALDQLYHWNVIRAQKPQLIHWLRYDRRKGLRIERQTGREISR